MNNSSVFLIGFITGIVIGTATTALIIKVYDQREKEAEIEALKEHYIRAEEKNKPNDEPDKQKPSYIVSSLDKPKSEKNVRDIKRATEITDYNNYAKLVRTSPDVEKADVVVTYEPDPETYDSHLDDLYPTEEDPEPEEIDIDSWENDPEFEKVELLYYAWNDTLVDEHYDPVPKSFIGEENLDLFQRESQIFIRNRGNGADYCVTLVNGAWTGDDT